MKKIVFGVAAVFALLVACHADGVKWVKDYATAKTQALKSNKLMMLDFYTDW